MRSSCQRQLYTKLLKSTLDRSKRLTKIYWSQKGIFRSERSERSDSNCTNGRAKSTFFAKNDQFDRNLYLSIFGKIWNILEKFGIFWKNLEYFGKTWNMLEKFEIGILDKLGKIWNILEIDPF